MSWFQEIGALAAPVAIIVIAIAAAIFLEDLYLR
uniref:Uncharacterized protein n=1 Tax=Rhizobium leguminosarum bv. trifolii TaxID=386 RepID=A0A1C9I1E4_RHILT|nr:hypothetical protein [Rhizobium leguminosarum bv. trifolii]